jgi:hypothetical protein
MGAGGLTRLFVSCLSLLWTLPVGMGFIRPALDRGTGPFLVRMKARTQLRAADDPESLQPTTVLKERVM